MNGRRKKKPGVFSGMPVWVIPATVVMAIGTVWLRLAVVRTTYAINESDRSIHNLEQQREQVLLRIAALRSPRRLEQLAKGRFGLSSPSASRVIHLREEGTLATGNR
jgi:cell division protein FtsL